MRAGGRGCLPGRGAQCPISLWAVGLGHSKRGSDSLSPRTQPHNKAEQRERTLVCLSPRIWLWMPVFGGRLQSPYLTPWHPALGSRTLSHTACCHPTGGEVLKLLSKQPCVCVCVIVCAHVCTCVTRRGRTHQPIYLSLPESGLFTNTSRGL